MKAQRLGVDTPVLGACFDPEFARWLNALFEDSRGGRLRPVISEVITAEVTDAPQESASYGLISYVKRGERNGATEI